MKLVMQEVQHRRSVAKEPLDGDVLEVSKDADADAAIGGEGDEKYDEKMGTRSGDDRNRDRVAGQDAEWDWLKGKTVVLYGDSVLRYNMDHFCKVSRGWRYPLPPFFPGRSQTRSYPIVMPCPHIHIRVERSSDEHTAAADPTENFRSPARFLSQFVGSEIKPIPWNSPAGVPWPDNVNPYSTPHRPFDPDDSSEQDGSGWKDSKPDPPGNGNHWPHICYVEEVDFLVVHVHQYGMDLTDVSRVWGRSGAALDGGSVVARC
jgi:hypothetical protein